MKKAFRKLYMALTGQKEQKKLIKREHQMHCLNMLDTLIYNNVLICLNFEVSEESMRKLREDFVKYDRSEFAIHAYNQRKAWLQVMYN